MKNCYEKEDLENDATYRFLRDLSLPAESSVEEETPLKKRTKVDHQNWYPIDRVSAPKYYDLDSGENLIEPEHDLSATGPKETTSSQTGNDSQSKRQSYVATAVWDVIDPQGSVRGLSVSIPDAPVFCTGMVSPGEEKSENSDKAPLLSSHKKIRYSKFELCPPHTGNIPRPTVDRPLGCKTVSLAGFPFKMKEDYVREIFRDCGNIHKIKQKTPGVYHVTFSSESAIDNALQFNGYTIVIKSDRHRTPHKGIIEVDFVPVWKEQQEYDHRVRAIQKEMNSNNGTCVSTADSNFSEAEIVKLVEGLHDESLFNDGINRLVIWMEEGRCHKRNAFQFFSVLQALQSLVPRLMKDTAKLEEEVQEHQCRLSGKYAANSMNFAEILKAFDVASSRNVWDKFTDSQKKRIEMWKKHIMEINESNSQDMKRKGMDNGEEKKMSPINGESSLTEQQTVELVRLRKENERLKKELKVAQREGLGSNRGQKGSLPIKTENGENHQVNNNGISNHVNESVRIVEKEACFIAAIGAFLNFHRFGESIQCICKYLLNIDSTVTTEDIEHLMRKFPTVFKEKSVKDDVGLKRKWTVIGF